MPRRRGEDCGVGARVRRDAGIAWRRTRLDAALPAGAIGLGVVGRRALRHKGETTGAAMRVEQRSQLRRRLVRIEAEANPEDEKTVDVRAGAAEATVTAMPMRSASVVIDQPLRALDTLRP